MINLPFTKMHGIGNDFIILNNLEKQIPLETYPELTRKLCNRNFGVGADGVMILEKGSHHPYKMKMLNPDGTESAACGNGTRCFAIYLKEKGFTKQNNLVIEGPVRPLTLNYLDKNLIEVNMGQASLQTKDIKLKIKDQTTFINQPIKIQTETFYATAVSIGNPHLVIFTENITEIPLETYGPILEFFPLFVNGTNVHFAKIISPTSIEMRTWERSAGITLACGSGACATAVAGFAIGKVERITQLSLPGGTLEIHYKENNDVLMKGAAITVFEGQWPITL